MSPHLAELYRRMEQASTTADEATQDYETSKARLFAGLDRAGRRAAIKDDYELNHLGNRATFWTARASRLALQLLVELALDERDRVQTRETP
jgi:hypothetical protein